jgi:hypothetical protein
MSAEGEGTFTASDRQGIPTQPATWGLFVGKDRLDPRHAKSRQIDDVDTQVYLVLALCKRRVYPAS